MLNVNQINVEKRNLYKYINEKDVTCPATSGKKNENFSKSNIQNYFSRQSIRQPKTQLYKFHFNIYTHRHLLGKWA